MGRTSRKRKHKSKTGQNYCNATSSDNTIINLTRHLASIGWLNENHLKVGWFGKKSGRGIFSKNLTNYSTSRPLIELPCTELITLATLEQDSQFKYLIKSSLKSQNTNEKISVQSLLALYLLYLDHAKQKLIYLDTIPKSFTNPFFCKKSELMLLPQALFIEILKQDNDIKLNYSNITKIIGNLQCECCQRMFMSDLFTIELFKMAYFAVNTRTVYFEPEICNLLCETHDLWNIISDKANAALAPFIDLFNHSDEVICTSNISKPLNEIRGDPMMRNELKYQLSIIGKSYRKYEQIFVNYGSLCNFKLIVDYGFFLPNNRHDRIPIDMSDIKELVKETNKYHIIHRNKFKFIVENSFDQEMFIDRWDGLSHPLFVALTILFVTEGHWDNVLNKVAFSVSTDLKSVHKWATKIIAMKRAYFECYKNVLVELSAKEHISECAQMVHGYIEECIRLLDYVIEVFFK